MQELGPFGSEAAPFRGPEGTCFGVSRETAVSGAALGSVLNAFWAPRCPPLVRNLFTVLGVATARGMLNLSLITI